MGSGDLLVFITTINQYTAILSSKRKRSGKIRRFSRFDLFFAKPDNVLWSAFFQKAKQAIMFYKRWNENDQQQKMLLESEFERLKSIDEERKLAPKIQLKDFMNRMAVKGILMSLAVSWFLQMTGCYTIMNYASYIFEKSGGTIFNTNISSTILAIVQIIGGLVSTQMGDTFGRKTTLAISLCGSMIGLISFAGYLFMRHMQHDVTNFIWLPLTSLSLMYVSLKKLS